MTNRLLHPAPPDYGIVEVREPNKRPRFLVYHQGGEIAVCMSLEQAQALTDSHRMRPANGGGTEPGNKDEPPLPVGCP